MPAVTDLREDAKRFAAPTRPAAATSLWAVWRGPWGEFGLRLGAGGAVERLALPGPAALGRVPAGAVDAEELEAARPAVAWLRGWLAGERPGADLPTQEVGTAFRRGVWAAMRRIPTGKTRTYGELAAELGRPGAARAVGLACRNNPLPLWTPCHRIVGADGRLIGFSGGAGPETKRRLLAWENERAAASAATGAAVPLPFDVFRGAAA